MLDEGTAHLDEENERKLLANIEALNVIVIMTAHKSDLASFGTQVWNMSRDGRLDVAKTNLS